MAKAGFFLKDPKSKSSTLVYLIFNFNYYVIDPKSGKKKYKFLKYSTGEKISPKFWNPESHRAKETSKFSGYSEFNSRLESIESMIFTIHRRLLNDGEKPTPNLLREKLDIELGKKDEKNVGFFDFIESYIEEAHTVKRINTIKKYKTTLKRLKEYSLLKKRNLEFDQITVEFYYDFLNYLRKEMNYTDNTAGKYISTLKHFLNEALDRGYNSNIEFKSKKFKRLSEEVDKIYLTEKEIRTLYDLNLTDNKKLERVRDLFVLECYLGLRFKDTTQLKPENIIKTEKGNIIKIKTEKTGEVVAIPLHKIVNEIIEKYEGNFPESISNQKMNDYLKDLGKLAEINEKVLISRIKGGNDITQTFYKYELITTHTARRSFATNAFLAGVPSISIMKITGHRTESSFLRYIRMSAEENAINLLDHNFFK